MEVPIKVAAINKEIKNVFILIKLIRDEPQSYAESVSHFHAILKNPINRGSYCFSKHPRSGLRPMGLVLPSRSIIIPASVPALIAGDPSINRKL